MRLNRERTQKFFKMEEVNLDLLNIEQEDDNLLGASPFVPSSNECLLSPPMISAACRKVSTDDLENHYGEFACIRDSICIEILKPGARMSRKLGISQATLGE